MTEHPNGGGSFSSPRPSSTGLALGSMYGLIALGFHVTYVVSNTVNFSQGSSVMLGAVLGYIFAVRLGWPLPLACRRGPPAAAPLFGLRRRAHAGAPVRGARLERLADGDGGRRHRARQRGAVHLRQGAAQLPVPADEQADRAVRRRRLSAAARHPRGRHLGIAVALALAVAPDAAAARRCWPWCRTPMPRG